ncbi:MAG: F0F1 ATP synthase subunit A [Bacteroidales bacterium]|nr:F0F1 ATP synthase subunit A [Bacteroidales bacterium]
MKRIKSIFLLLFAAIIAMPIFAQEAPAVAEAEQKEEAAINIPEIVLEHLADSYEWHICGEGEHAVSIPLPIIIRSSETGQWHFCTEETLPEGFFFNEEAHGKIYEKHADGTSERALDLSLTKSAVQIWIVVFVMLAVFLSCSRWYKKRDEKSEAPRGFVGMMEMLTMAIHDGVIRACVGEKHYKKFAPYLLTVFFFILTTNILGLLPIFPGGANVTGNINITFFLAVCTMLLVNIFGNKEYWKEIFWPEVPLFLKAYPAPLIPVIEVVGIFTKPFALMVRLFANMMAGHAIILSFTCVIFLGWTMGTGMGIGLNAFSALMLLFMNLVEVLVAFVQAYVFTLLSAVFIGLAHPEHHAE